MSLTLINFFFYLSCLSPFLGFAIFIFLVKKWWSKTSQITNIKIIFIRVLPALIVWIIFCIPFFYMIGMKGDFDHCRKIVEVNPKFITRENLAEENPKCRKFNIDELFAE